MIEIWGRRNSSNVMSALWALDELGLDYQRHDIGGSFGGNQSAEFLALNPNGVVPAMRDGEMVLFESNVIVRYLSAQYGVGSLWHKDERKRAVADQWMEWCKTTLYAAFVPVFLGLVRTAEAERDMDKITVGVERTIAVLEILEQRLGVVDYVGGDQFSMGDIPFGGIMYRYFNVNITRPDLPNVLAWYERLCARPGFVQHCMVPFGRSLEEWLVLEKAGAGQ